MVILPETRTISVQHISFIIDDRIAVFIHPDTAVSCVAVLSARKTSIIDKRSSLIHPDACFTGAVVNQNRCICIQYQTKRFLSLNIAGRNGDTLCNINRTSKGNLSVQRNVFGDFDALWNFLIYARNQFL